MGKKDKGFAATTRLEIIGQFQEVEKQQKWKFKKLDLDKIELEADTGGFSIEGNLVLMNDDPEYGDGFSGDLNVKLGI